MAHKRRPAVFITITILFYARDIDNHLSTSTVVSTVEIPHTQTLQEFDATINKHLSDLLTESRQDSIAKDPAKIWTLQSIMWTPIPNSVSDQSSHSIA